ncbi:MAG: alpha-D-ribose 1-methylphosphonate 5-triphosphate diphosphatase, partial [Planctomycetota bacterium]
MSRSYVLNACRVLTPDGFEQGRSLYIHEGRFVDAATPDMVQLDAAACTVYPGIIDLHGDAFERELAPRPGVEVPVEV